MLLDMHEKLSETVQQKYFYSICKCTVVFKMKILNLQMLSKNALCMFKFCLIANYSNSVLSLNAFMLLNAFETCRNLNSTCSLQTLVTSLKKKIPSLLSNVSHVIHKDQIFDDEIDHKCCVKNLLRFLSNNIPRIFKDFCYIVFLKIRIILRVKRYSGR